MTATGELQREARTRFFSRSQSLSLAPHSPPVFPGRRRACSHRTEDFIKHLCKRGDGRSSGLATEQPQRGAPWKGADGSSAGWVIIPSLARHKFPSRASSFHIPLARGVDIIARDYVKPQPKAEAGGGSWPGQGPRMPAFSDRAARAVTGSLTTPPPSEPGAALGTRDEALPGRPSPNIRPRPAPSAAWGGRHPSTTSRPRGGRG